MDPKYHVFVKITAAESSVEELLNALLSLANSSLLTDFCEEFHVTRAKDSDDTFYLIETFSSENGYAKHLETDHVKHFLAEVIPNLTSEREAIFLENQSSRVDNNP